MRIGIKGLRGLARLTVVVGTVQLLAVAVSAQQAADYYPMKEGLRWTRAWVTNYGQKQRWKEVVSHQAAVKLTPFGSVIPQLRQEVGGGRTFYFVRSDATGIGIVASQQATDAEPRPLEYTVLKNPTKVGTKWQVVYTPPPILAGRSFAVPLEVAIASVDETVVLPSGNYQKVLQVVSTGAAQNPLKLPETGDRVLGILRDRVSRQEWFARGVGLLKAITKLEHSVEETGRVVRNETYTWAVELEAFEK